MAAVEAIWWRAFTDTTRPRIRARKDDWPRLPASELPREHAPERINTDKLGSYAAAIRRLPELVTVEHQQVRAAMQCDNRVEQAHQPTRIRERRMARFRCAISTQQFLGAFGRVSNLFRPRRHLLTAAQYHSTIQDRFATWRTVVGSIAT